jgi:N-acetylglucosamine-6-sulfatase
MSAKLFDLLEQTKGMQIPLARDAGERNVLRNIRHGTGAPFPASLLVDRQK